MHTMPSCLQFLKFLRFQITRTSITLSSNFSAKNLDFSRLARCPLAVAASLLPHPEGRLYSIPHENPPQSYVKIVKRQTLCPIYLTAFFCQLHPFRHITDILYRHILKYRTKILSIIFGYLRNSSYLCSRFMP